MVGPTVLGTGAGTCSTVGGMVTSASLVIQESLRVGTSTRSRPPLCRTATASVPPRAASAAAWSLTVTGGKDVTTTVVGPSDFGNTPFRGQPMRQSTAVITR